MSGNSSGEVRTSTRRTGDWRTTYEWNPRNVDVPFTNTVEGWKHETKSLPSDVGMKTRYREGWRENPFPQLLGYPGSDCKWPRNANHVYVKVLGKGRRSLSNITHSRACIQSCVEVLFKGHLLKGSVLVYVNLKIWRLTGGFSDME